MPSQKKAKEKRREQRDRIAALETQLRFINNSCLLFGQGHLYEAIRIATQLRVILHPGSGKNKSLLQQLGVHTQVKLLSTCHPVGPEAVMYQGMGTFTYSSDGTTTSMSFHPGLDDTSFKAEMRFHDWWEQIVWVMTPVDLPKVVLRRKDIVLTAAHKDGGAHFDELPPDYEYLASAGAAGSFVYTDPDGTEHVTPIGGAHFVCLRQIGFEILHSTDISDLLRRAA